MPLLWQRDPRLVLRIVGAQPTPEVARLHGECVDVVGEVVDPAHWLSLARVHLAPLRYGSGIKLRFLDSMAAGLPFVTTRLGAEGLGLGEVESGVIADAREAIADLTWKLYTSKTDWEKAQRALRDVVATRFSPAVFRQSVEAATSALGIPRPEQALDVVRSQLFAFS
jgi:glycosyltransferase involved in cell wall biosynthesis